MLLLFWVPYNTPLHEHTTEPLLVLYMPQKAQKAAASTVKRFPRATQSEIIETMVQAMNNI